MDFSSRNPPGSVMRTFVLYSLLISSLFISSSLPADTIVVPDDFSTIQEAITQALDGDTVLVRPGRYFENIDFLGKAIIVKSELGPAVTTIDGNQSGSVVTFENGEGPGSVLEGFTLTNGSGHGINPTYMYGGGVYCGGISGDSPSPIIRGNVITGNQVSANGGGICCSWTDSLVLVGNLIYGNWAGDSGGGIYISLASDFVIKWNIVQGNHAGFLGGGIYIGFESYLDLSRNTFTANSAGYGGGGVSCYGSTSTFTNSILWANEAPTGPEIYLSDWLYPSTLFMSYSDVSGGESSAYVEGGCSLVWGPGNIDDAPLFTLPALRDYRLLWESPCIDAGDPQMIDPDGTRSDIGARFFDQDDLLTLYLTPHARRIAKGGELTVTYTLMNRWEVPASFVLLTQVLIPGHTGGIDIVGPVEYTIPAGCTAQLPIDHEVPRATPPIVYEYRSQVSSPELAIYGEDDFTFEIFEIPKSTEYTPFP